MNAKSAFFLFSMLLCLSCVAQPPVTELQLGAGKRVLFLTGEESGTAVTVDKTNGYFEKVTASEMSIQMKTPLKPGQTAADLREAYKAFLRTDMADFTKAETDFVSEIFEGIFKTTEQISKDIFPKELKLLKTKGKHVGDGVFYTRENCIVIPQNELDARDKEGFTSTMYHELFHVYSRLNPAKSKALYKLIGFEAIGYNNLVVPEKLGERVILNPDGVDFAQKITLSVENGKTIHAIPVLFSNHGGFEAGKTSFFAYVEFNLYEIVQEGSSWRVVTQADGLKSTLNMEKLPDFFRQIRDNTHYIIHPDEVLADNFSFLMLSQANAKVTEKFSKEGKQLIADLESVLKQSSIPAGPGSNR